LIALGFVGSLYAVYRIVHSNYPNKVWGTFVPYAALMILLTAINIWLFIAHGNENVIDRSQVGIKTAARDVPLFYLCNG
jgi:hypothetical protein